MTRSTTLALSLLLTGCAYSSAMKHGARAAADDDATRAFDAYAYAWDLKESEDARAGMEEALGLLLEDAEQAAGSGKYEEAFAALDEARRLDPDAVKVAETRAEIGAMLIKDLPKRTETKDIKDGYTFAAKAKRWLPDSPEVEDQLGVLRERVVEQAETHQEAREWEAARAAAAVILDYEPEHRTLAKALDDAIVGDWIGWLVKKADAVDAGRPGLAAVLYARAFEIAGDEAHKERARELYAAAGDDALRMIHVESDGGGGRHWGVRKAVRAAALELPGTKKGWSSKYDLRPKIYTNAIKCDEEREATPKSKDYVAGTRQVSNPKYEELSEKQDKAAREKREAMEALSAIESKHAAAGRDKVALEKDLDEANKALSKASEAVEQTKEQHTKSQSLAEEIEAELKRWKDEGNETGVEGAAKRLEDAEALVAEWSDKLKGDLETESKARDAVSKAEEKLEPVASKFARLEAELTAATSRSDEARKEVDDLITALADTSETLPEDINKTHEYDEVVWTLTCDVKSTVYWAAGWKTEREKKEVFEGTRTVTDTEIKAHEPSGVKGDPKEYPKTRDELVAELEKEDLDNLVGGVGAFLDDYVQVTAATGLASDDPDTTAAYMVMLLAGMPDRLDKKTREAALERLKTDFGLEDFGVLDPDAQAGAPAAPAATEEATEDEGEDAEGEDTEAKAEDSGEEAEEAQAKDDTGEDTDSVWK